MGVSLNSGTAIGNQNMGDPVFLVDALGRPIGNGGTLIVEVQNPDPMPVDLLLVTSLAPLRVTTTTSVPTYVASFSSIAMTANGVVGALRGSATKTIRISEIGLTSTTDFTTFGNLLPRRHTTFTGGTAGAVPVVTPMDSTFAAGTAVASTYTVPPTVNNVGQYPATKFFSPAVAGTNGGASPVILTFGDNDSAIVLRGVSEWLGLLVTLGNYTGASVNGWFKWTEEDA